MARDSDNDWPTILKAMLHDSGETYRSIGQKMGRSESYMGGVISNCTRGSVPSAEVLAMIAEACGYEVHVTGHDRDFRIRP